jgi:hypothetical protein
MTESFIFEPRHKTLGKSMKLLRKTVSGVMLILLLTGILTLAFNIKPTKASGTIYIRADGPVEPPDAPISSIDNVTYTFTADIYDEIARAQHSHPK